MKALFLSHCRCRRALVFFDVLLSLFSNHLALLGSQSPPSFSFVLKLCHNNQTVFSWSSDTGRSLKVHAGNIIATPRVQFRRASGCSVYCVCVQPFRPRPRVIENNRPRTHLLRARASRRQRALGLKHLCACARSVTVYFLPATSVESRYMRASSCCMSV